MTVAIQYSKPSSGKDGGEIFGLDVAVNNFLSAYFKHSQQEQFICRPTDLPSFEHFKSLAQAAGVDAEKRCIGIDPRYPQHNLQKISCLFRPDPLTADLTWRRLQVPAPGFVTCGLVHTMSGERIARAVNELCLSPSDVTDALICPSDAIRDVVQNLWAIHTDYLRHRFGTSYRCEVQTPVIPLGIDTEKFQRLTTPEKRAAQRKALNASDDDIILLFLGRLSFATKAHPLALWQAAQRAAQETKKKIRVVMFGYFKPKDMEKHYRDLAAEIGKDAPIEFIMNDDARFPDGLWAGADIFTSLSDNIQESFGLTPVEAMAAGLPVVITDWNGYRGSARDREDGFLIRTLTPPVSSGLAIAQAYYNEENYGVSLMGAAQSTTIDIGQCATAIADLANNADKRRSMGASARLRAQNTFDWKHIIPAYETLWAELAAKRQAQPQKSMVPAHWPAMHPSYPNPFQMFRSFPSAVITPHNIVQVVMPVADIQLIIKHEMNFFLPELLAPKETMLELIEVIRKAGTPRVADITAAFPVNEHDRILRCLGWMLKHGVAVMVRK